MRNSMSAILVVAAVVLAGCASSERRPEALPQWSFDPEMIFPGDRSLNRPEDGVGLSDGRVVVADQVDGLRLVSPDGSSRPFGRFADAGYLHSPPETVGGPNGVTLEPGGTHVLVSDVFRGGIYRVALATEATERIYQHEFGVNVARADRSGGIWFTQSTENDPQRGEEELFRSVDIPVADGALYYLPPATDGQPRAAVRVVDGLYLANGLALDETAGYLYLSETMGKRVLRYRLDVPAGRVTDRTIVLEGFEPDNLELDRHNRLWIAVPLRSEIVVFDPASNAAQSVFRLSGPEHEPVLDEIETRLREGRSWLELLAPPLWEPAPGLITGVILAPDDGPVYLTGLGDALLRLKR